MCTISRRLYQLYTYGCLGATQASSLSAQLKAAVAQIQRRKRTLVRSIFVVDYRGKYRLLCKRGLLLNHVIGFSESSRLRGPLTLTLTCQALHPAYRISVASPLLTGTEFESWHEDVDELLVEEAPRLNTTWKSMRHVTRMHSISCDAKMR